MSWTEAAWGCLTGLLCKPIKEKPKVGGPKGGRERGLSGNIYFWPLNHCLEKKHEAPVNTADGYQSYKLEILGRSGSAPLFTPSFFQRPLLPPPALSFGLRRKVPILAAWHWNENQLRNFAHTKKERLVSHLVNNSFSNWSSWVISPTSPLPLF